MTDSDRQKQFARRTLLIVLVALSSTSLLLVYRDVYDYNLWQENIRDPGRRWKPHAREDINSDGFRSYQEAADFKPDDFNIIFIGDSFTFGHLLPPEYSLPMQFQALADERMPGKKIHVINFGWSGCSPYLALPLLKDKAAKYHPKLVILMLDVTDFKDDYFYQHLVEKIGFYKLMVDHPVLAFYPRKLAAATEDYTGWHETIMGFPNKGNYFLLHQPYEQSLPFFEDTYRNLEKINDYVTHELHARLVVFIPPRHWQYTDKESTESWERQNYVTMGPYVLNNFIYFDQKAKEAPFAIISLLEDFRQTAVFPTNFTRDSHWNPAGAQLAAELIFEHCEKLSCIE